MRNRFGADVDDAPADGNIYARTDSGWTLVGPGLSYLGTWNATTNTPALTNGTGTAGDFYKVSTAGSHDFGAGAIVFNVGDWVIYEGDIWQQVGSHEAVASVNGQTGAVVLAAADIGALDAAGTAVQATKLETARAITLSGAATGTANFDGSAAVNIAVTIPAGTVLAPGILQVGDGLGMQSPGIVALAAPGGSKLGGIYLPNAPTGLDVTDGVLTAPGLVPKVSTVSVVYANNGTGVATPIAYAATAATANTMVQRDTNGCVVVNPPTAELHATNRGYVDPRTLTQAAVTAVGALTPIATADATDPATTMALVNGCKAKINSIIAALKAT